MTILKCEQYQKREDAICEEILEICDEINRYEAEGRETNSLLRRLEAVMVEYDIFRRIERPRSGLM